MLLINFYDDKQSTMTMIDLKKYSSKAKQEYDYYLKKHLKQTGIINQKYCEIKMMIADLFTEPLPR